MASNRVGAVIETSELRTQGLLSPRLTCLTPECKSLLLKLFNKLTSSEEKFLPRDHEDFFGKVFFFFFHNLNWVKLLGIESACLTVPQDGGGMTNAQILN